MLRDYPFTLSPKVFKPVLEQFDMEHPGKDANIALLEFKVITPDSFIWKFLINDAIYYLYAEDFIDSLKSVSESIKALMKDQSEFEYVKIKHPKDFENAGPVLVSTKYKRPDDYETMKLYSADADYDFAFLVKSKEDPSEAYFNTASS
jgi:hypothetical protein